MLNTNYKTLTALLCLLLIPGFLAAQATISGKVTDSQTGEALVGANVVLLGTSQGAAADINGNYAIDNVSDGDYWVVARYLGYSQLRERVSVTGSDITVNFELESSTYQAEELNVIADRAVERSTPVAFSNVSKQKIEENLGSRDIPMVLNTTPSVYSTMQGGGAGDARINVRGFNQRNVAIMINGVPVNDMENGWVYWSNWDGLGDATASIQMQRGLSAVNLATPSIGGTMNIITDPTTQDAGGYFKQEYGSGTFLKTTVGLNSGLINNRYAISGNIVRKTGDGYIDATWTDAWAYYLGGALNINSRNRLELYAVGAPQRHGQNLYRQNIGAYDHDFARSLDDYDVAALDDFSEVDRFYNETWNTVSTSYAGRQSFNGSTHDRYASDFINERENYFHKPQVNLNWYSQLTESANLYTVAYYSGGKGGGSGTLGSLGWNYDGPSRIADWDATIVRNTSNLDDNGTDLGSRGILRNSVNNQWTIGAISKMKYNLNSSTNVTVGVDWRTAEIDHYREVRDLLGGAFFRCNGDNRCGSSDFWTEADEVRGLGDKIHYDNTNNVSWLGGFGQAEYSNGLVNAYGMAGYSIIQYDHENHFLDDGTGSALVTSSDNIGGYQLKGGVGYLLDEQIDVYANVGLVSKVPIFDNVINDFNGALNTDPSNEKFTSAEAGVNFRSSDRRFTGKISAYYTQWNDRSFTRGVRDANNNENLVSLSGINTNHAGIEFEGAFQPVRQFRLDAAASFGNWKHTDDATGTYRDYSSGAEETVPYTLYIKDLKVGDAPQTQLALLASFYPTSGLRAQLTSRFYANHYADWDPLGRDDADDRAQSWSPPNYMVLDAHFSYDLPVNLGNNTSLQLFGHAFNLLDEVYVQDALDNSRFNAFDGDHDADDAEVYLGLPRNFNLGIRVRF